MPLGDLAWLLVMLVVCAVLLVVALRIEPHWSRSDGSTFSCFTQSLTSDGRPSGPWREARAELVDDRVSIRPRLFLRLAAPGDGLRVVARGTSPRKGKSVYLLEASERGHGFVAVRVPDRSPARNRLEALVP